MPKGGRKRKRNTTESQQTASNDVQNPVGPFLSDEMVERRLDTRTNYTRTFKWITNLSLQQIQNSCDSNGNLILPMTSECT